MSSPSLLDIIMSIPGVLMGFTFHEFGHAYAATLLGDDTPRLQGRVTLSPLAHLDPIGTILLLIGGFGWAKPVQVNPNRLRPRPWADIAVSLAGVFMNFLLALIFYAAALISVKVAVGGGYYNPVLTDTLQQTAWINVILIGFNLLPIPPLDGFRVVSYLLPASMGGLVSTLERYGPMLLILVFGLARYQGASLLSPVYQAIWHGVGAMVQAVVGVPI